MQRFSTLLVRKRIAVLFVAAACLFSLLAVRLIYLQLIRADHLSAMALEQRLRPVPLLAERGVIFDRNDRVLAASMSFEAAYAIPIEVEDVSETAQKLAPIIGLPRENLEQRLSANRSIEWLNLRLTPEQADEIRLLNLPGIGVQERPLRYYPNGSLAAQIIGFAGIDNQGLEGIELRFDRYLRGQDGMVVRERDAAGRAIPAGIERRIAPTDGFDIALTIDSVVQYIAEREIERGVIEADADWGIFIGVHPQTGEVLAIAQYPTFDPNNYSDYPGDRWRNKAIVDMFEPGSTFKVVTTAAALDTGVATMDSTYVDPVTLHIDSGQVSCWLHGGHGTQNLVEALENSCNPIFSMLAEDLTGPVFHDYIKKFGFGGQTGIDFPGETIGIVPDAESRLLTWANVGFGQGIGTSALQMVMALSAIANGGEVLQPYIVDQVRSNTGEVIIQSSPRVIGRAISPSTARDMRDMLRSVVERGSGVRADIPGYPAGGKTGTAQIAAPGGYLTGHKSNMASFMAFAPVDDPQIAGIVMLYRVGQEPSYGGIWAAPVFGRIAGEALEVLGVPRGQGDEPEDDGLVRMPNVINLYWHDAEELLLVHDLRVTGQGAAGFVVDQTPPPGAMIQRGTNVRLTFYDETPDHADHVRVPDVTGRSMKDAAVQLSLAGLRIEIEGTGFAVSQDPEPGAEAHEGDAVKVRFSPP